MTVSTSPESSTDVNANATTTGPNEGVSNPPDAGAVTSVATPPQESAAPAQPGTASIQPSTDTSADNVQADQTQRPLQKINPPAQPLTPPKTPVNDPSMKRAFKFRDLAETLAGGARYKENIDVNTGKTTYTKIPLSRADLGMAIAMEAITGALSGLQQSGPGANARAAGAGFATTAAQMKEAQQQEQQRAQQDVQNQSAAIARQAAIADHNFTTLRNQMTLSNMDYDMQMRDVTNAKASYDELQQLGAVKEVVDDTPDMLEKYHITRDMALPVEVNPKIGTDGKQARNSYGVPLWNKRVAIVDPNKIMSFPPGVLKMLQDHHVPGYVNSDGSPISIPQDARLRAHFILGGIQKATAIQLFEKQMNDWNKGTPSHGGSTGGSIWTLFKGADGAADFGKLADAMADHESGGDANARSVRNNNPGNLKAYAKGQKVDKDGFRVFDSPEEGRAAMISQLKLDAQRFPDASPAQYLATKYTVGDSPDKVKGYADSLLKKAGVSASDFGPTSVAPDVDIKAQIAGNAGYINAITEFQKYGTAGVADGRMEKDEEAGKIPAGTTGLIKQLMGGDDGIHLHNDLVAAHHQEILDGVKRNYTNQVNQDKQDRDDEASRDIQKMLTPPDGYKFSDDMYEMSMPDLEKKLKDMGVTIPADFASLYKQAHYELNPAQFANRIWRKGDRIGMSRPDAGSFITTFVNPGYDDTNYNMLASMRKELGSQRTGTLGSAVTSFNQFLQHAGNAFDVNNEYRRSGKGDALNMPLTWWRTHMSGDPGVQKFRTALSAVKNEYVSFLQNNHALTEHDKELADSLLNENMSPAKIETTLKEMADIASARLYAVNQTWYRGYGKNIPGLLNPQAAKALSMLGADSDATQQLADMDVGGHMQDGRFVYGQRLREYAGIPPEPGATAGRDPQSGKIIAWKLPNGQVQYVNGQKPSQPQQPQQSQQPQQQGAQSQTGQ